MWVVLRNSKAGVHQSLRGSEFFLEVAKISYSSPPPFSRLPMLCVTELVFGMTNDAKLFSVMANTFPMVEWC